MPDDTLEDVCVLGCKKKYAGRSDSLFVPLVGDEVVQSSCLTSVGRDGFIPHATVLIKYSGEAGCSTMRAPSSPGW